MSKPRARELGLPLPGEPGPLNAVTDVPGVRVGLTTVIDEARGIRTGVTAIVPREDAGRPQPVWAGFAKLNGNGEMTGTHWIEDAGHFVGPVCITNSRVHHRKPRGRPMAPHVRRGDAGRSKLRAAVEHVLAQQKGPMGLFIRTIGLARAEVKIGMANIAYNMRRLVWQERRRGIA